MYNSFQDYVTGGDTPSHNRECQSTDYATNMTYHIAAITRFRSLLSQPVMGGASATPSIKKVMEPITIYSSSCYFWILTFDEASRGSGGLPVMHLNSYLVQNLNYCSRNLIVIPARFLCPP